MRNHSKNLNYWNS